MRKQHRELSERERQLVQDIKDGGAWLLDAIDVSGTGREQSLAKTKVEEAVMWAVKGVTG